MPKSTRELLDRCRALRDRLSAAPARIVA
jgi:hypothetical protein